MSRITIILGACLALALAYGFYVSKEYIRVNDTLNAQIELREAAEAREARIKKDLRKVESNYASSELRLATVLNGRPVTLVPEPVYKLLCERGRCAKLDPLPTPLD